MNLGKVGILIMVYILLLWKSFVSLKFKFVQFTVTFLYFQR